MIYINLTGFIGFVLEGDVLCGNESNGITHLGILQEWFGINWLTSRAFALLFVALFIMLPLVMLRRVGQYYYYTQMHKQFFFSWQIKRNPSSS